MDVYKENIKYYESLDKLNLRILVIVDLQNKEMVGYNWSQTLSTRTLKYLLENYTNNKVILHQLNFIGACIQANLKNRVL